MATAFASSAALSVKPITPTRQVCAHTSSTKVHVGRMRMTQMKETEAESTSADLTREALSNRKSKVKFSKGVAEEQKQDFAYTSGVEDGVDVWLVTGVLTFLVPLVAIVLAVKAGVVDLTPR